jgi:hypothetical protein
MAIMRVLLRTPLALIAFSSLQLAAQPNLTSPGANNWVEPDLFCHSPGADRGYRVEIRLGSSAETARVSVGADSRVGVQRIEVYDVSVTPSGSSTLFQGRYLTFTLSEGRLRSDNRIGYDATLTAEYGGHAIQDRLGCSAPQPQATPPG